MNVFASVSIHCMPLCASLCVFFSGIGTAHSKKKTSKIGGGEGRGGGGGGVWRHAP